MDHLIEAGAASKKLGYPFSFDGVDYWERDDCARQFDMVTVDNMHVSVVREGMSLPGKAACQSVCAFVSLQQRMIDVFVLRGDPKQSAGTGACTLTTLRLCWLEMGHPGKRPWGPQ